MDEEGSGVRKSGMAASRLGSPKAKRRPQPPPTSAEHLRELGSDPFGPTEKAQSVYAVACHYLCQSGAGIAREKLAFLRVS